MGHIASVCKKKYNEQREKNPVNHLSVISESDDDDNYDDEQCELQLGNLAGFNHFKVELMVSGKRINFEIDIGASVSVLSSSVYTKKFSEIPLRKTNIVLRSYDGSIIKPVGTMRAPVEYNGKKEPCEFLVVVNGGNPLVG